MSASSDRLDDAVASISAMGTVLQLAWIGALSPEGRRQYREYGGWSEDVHRIRSHANRVRQVLEDPRVKEEHRDALRADVAFVDAALPFLSVMSPPTGEEAALALAIYLDTVTPAIR